MPTTQTLLHTMARASEFEQLPKTITYVQVPENLLGYVRYCRSCLQFQQTRPAKIFASKALVIAEKHHDDIYRSQLQLIDAVALALGAEDNDTFDIKAVATALESAKSAIAAAKEGWLPPPLHDLVHLDPEERILQDSVVGPQGPAPKGQVPVLDALYATKVPDALPIGAISQLQQAAASAQAAAASGAGKGRAAGK